MRFAAFLVLSTALSTGLAAAGTLLSNTTPFSSAGNASSYLGNANSAYPNLMPSQMPSRAMPMPSRPFQPGINMAALNSRGMAKIRSLRHHWAVGVDSLPAAAIASPSGSLVAVPSALSVRWWATERLAVDALASGNYNSAQAGRGELSPLVSSSPGSAFYAGGLGLRYNVAALSHDLLSQVLIKASGAQSAESISGWSGKASETTLAVFVGAGFEAFVPGWDWLSVEASAGVTGFSQSLTPQSPGNGGPQTVSGVGLAGNGFSPVNLAAHVYF